MSLGTTSMLSIDDNTDGNDWYIVVENIWSSSALTSLNIISLLGFRFRQPHWHLHHQHCQFKAGQLCKCVQICRQKRAYQTDHQRWHLRHPHGANLKLLNNKLLTLHSLVLASYFSTAIDLLACIQWCLGTWVKLVKLANPLKLVKLASRGFWKNSGGAQKRIVEDSRMVVWKSYWRPTDLAKPPITVWSLDPVISQGGCALGTVHWALRPFTGKAEQFDPFTGKAEQLRAGIIWYYSALGNRVVSFALLNILSLGPEDPDALHARTLLWRPVYV